MFDGFFFMSFILVPKEGEDLQVNGWNWHPTLQLLLAAGVITEEDYEMLGCQGCGPKAKVDQEKAGQIADVLASKLSSMNPGHRMLFDLSVSSEPKKLAVFSPNMSTDDIDANELYSTTFEWLHTFAKFCRSSKGFKVM
jgi:hypothetical protein